MNMFPRIGNTQTLSQTIETQIKNAIVSKKFSAGDKLPTEKEMCDMFGVSRTALREALQKLNAQGLITIRKGSGIYVTDFETDSAIKPMSLYLELNLSKELILQVVEIRKMIEPQICGLAARNRDEGDLLVMQKVLRKIDQCDPMSFAKIGNLDRDFHLSICNATKNPIIPLMLDPIYSLMPKIKILVYETVDNARTIAHSTHDIIYHEIKAGNEAGAIEAMKVHLGDAENHSLRVVKKLKK